MAFGVDGSVLVPALVVLARAQTSSSREAAARAPIEAFFKAFNARDNEALKRSLHYPHVRINEQGRVNIWPTVADAATDFDALERSEGWARSSLDSVTMRANDAVKVHFEVLFSRYKADGTSTRPISRSGSSRSRTAHGVCRRDRALRRDARGF